MFSDILLKFRVENNLTQKEAAEALHITQRDVSMYENNKHKPTRKNEVILKERMENYKKEEYKNENL